jgi:hypothetical protein
MIEIFQAESMNSVKGVKRRLNEKGTFVSTEHVLQLVIVAFGAKIILIVTNNTITEGQKKLLVVISI